MPILDGYQSSALLMFINPLLLCLFFSLAQLGLVVTTLLIFFEVVPSLQPLRNVPCSPAAFGKMPWLLHRTSKYMRGWFDRAS